MGRVKDQIFGGHLGFKKWSHFSSPWSLSRRTFEETHGKMPSGAPCIHSEVFLLNFYSFLPKRLAHEFYMGSRIGTLWILLQQIRSIGRYGERPNSTSHFLPIFKKSLEHCWPCQTSTKNLGKVFILSNPLKPEIIASFICHAKVVCSGLSMSSERSL